MFEIHLGSTTDHKAFEAIINKQCKEIDVKYFFEQKYNQSKITMLDDSNFSWVFKDICSNIGVKLDVKTHPTSSDSRFLREVSLLFVQEF